MNKNAKAEINRLAQMRIAFVVLWIIAAVPAFLVQTLGIMLMVVALAVGTPGEFLAKVSRDTMVAITDQINECSDTIHLLEDVFGDKNHEA